MSSDSADRPGPPPDFEFDFGLHGEPGTPEPDLWESGQAPRTLVELVNRVLDRGVVVGGDAMISVAGVDLVYLGLNALLTSVSTARRTLGPRIGGEGMRVFPREAGAGEETGVAGVTGVPTAAAPRGGVAAGGTGDRVGTPPALPSSPAATPPPRDAAAATPATPAPSVSGGPAGAGTAGAEELAAELSEVVRALPERLDIDPDSVQRDLGRLVLVIVELLRRVVEHQALRRMDDDDLSEAQVERMGVALQRLEEKMQELKGVFGLADDDLDVDLGPLGKLY